MDHPNKTMTSKTTPPKALLVGINRYQLPGADLQGCVNDVTNLRDCLIKYFGATAGNIRVLTDARATRSAILDGLKWLIKDAKAGDQLLFHYSGHGSQIRDLDGDEVKDHMDEVLCPHDMTWDKGFITDDELDTLFRELPKGVNLEVLLDSCHSGTGTRELAALAQLPQEQYLRPRFLIPPVDIATRADDDLDTTRLLRATATTKRKTVPVLFAGCRDSQTSADAWLGGSYSGAFTYYLCKHIRDTQGQLPRGELITRLRASLRHAGFSQVPQLECPTAERKKRMWA